MQNIFSDANTAALKRLTVVLLAQDQSRAVRRALRYYSAWPCSVLVVDGSGEADAAISDTPANVRYLHAPALHGKYFTSRVREVVDQVATPYMVVTEVESFLLPEALGQSVAFLEQNTDYGTCQGYSLAFEAHADRVDYYLRDRKGCEDYSDESPKARLATLASESPSLATAVTRTAMLQGWFSTLAADFNPALRENAYSYALTAAAKVRLLPTAYALHPRSSITFGVSDQKLFESIWNAELGAPLRRFEPTQYVELPFYNQAFFDVLTSLEFLIHAIATGKLQFEELEAAMLKQKELSRIHLNASAEPLHERLVRAFELYAFNGQVVQQLADSLQAQGEGERARKVLAWGERLASATLEESGELFGAMRSGQLLRWLEGRNPSAAQVRDINQHLARHAGGPTFGILVLDLEADIFKLQATFDSVMNNHCRAFKVIVFTTGDLPASTTLQNTLHFVKVNASNYVDKINQVVEQADCDWMVLTEAGDELTPSGLYRASLELLSAPQCRAVAMDEFHRQEHGTLTDVFRPGVNLDLLQSAPALMARHWLIRREAMVQAGGYSREFKNAIEFDLLLRLIEQGGLDGLAHLDEPLLVCQAPSLEAGADERKTLLRHLASRGYQADVSTLLPGTHKIDYRFSERPMVSVIVHGIDDVEALQRCIRAVLQRTRYQRYEVLVADDSRYTEQLLKWLPSQGPQTKRVRLFNAEPGLEAASLINVASEQAQGDYLVTLAADGEVVNVNWIELLLNQVLRPEVGVAGAKLIDSEGRVAQAGLILDATDGVFSPFVGEPRNAAGYMNRLVVEQNCSAVSFACMMISKQLFNAADGADDAVFADALADVDLCLRLGQAGYLTVWTPHVQVIRPGVLARPDKARQAFTQKWSQTLGHDRYNNHHLATRDGGFTLGPVTSIPWASLIGQGQA